MSGPFFSWEVLAVSDIIVPSINSCLYDPFAAGLELKYVAFTWQFLTQNTLCESWLCSLHPAPFCSSRAFSAPGRGMPRQIKRSPAFASRFCNAVCQAARCHPGCLPPAVPEPGVPSPLWLWGPFLLHGSDI